MGTTLVGSTAQDAIVCQNDQRNKLTQITTYINGLKATAPQVDFLGSIDRAARDLGTEADGRARDRKRAADDRSARTSPTSGVLYADPAQVVSDLKSRNLLPTDLNGVTVYWSGMGDVGGAQAAADHPGAQQPRSRSGPRSSRRPAAPSPCSPSRPPGTAVSGLPAVSTVPVESVQTKTDWTHPIVIRNSELLFVKDTATFSDPAAAQQVLAPLVPSIEQNGQVVTITGHRLQGPGDEQHRRPRAVAAPGGCGESRPRHARRAGVAAADRRRRFPVVRVEERDGCERRRTPTPSPSRTARSSSRRPGSASAGEQAFRPRSGLRRVIHNPRRVHPVSGRNTPLCVPARGRKGRVATTQFQRSHWL